MAAGIRVNRTLGILEKRAPLVVSASIKVLILSILREQKGNLRTSHSLLHYVSGNPHSELRAEIVSGMNTYVYNISNFIFFRTWIVICNYSQNNSSLIAFEDVFRAVESTLVATYSTCIIEKPKEFLFNFFRSYRTLSFMFDRNNMIITSVITAEISREFRAFIKYKWRVEGIIFARDKRGRYQRTLLITVGV